MLNSLKLQIYNKIKLHKELVVIIVVALLLRLIGFWNGFPFVFHPDEPSVIRSALGIRFNPNPEHFDWPHLHFYLNFFLYMGFSVFRKILDLVPFLGFLKDTVIWRDPIIFYLLGRILNAFMGALTLIPIYLAGTQLKNKKVGLLASALFSVLPLHVRVSHYALIDVPATFWLTWGVYFSYKVFHIPTYKNYILSGLFFGLAMSSKYNGLFGALTLVFTHFLLSYQLFKDKKLTVPNFVAKPVLALVFCLFGFLLGTPYALFDYETFSITDNPKGAYWQFTNVGSVDFPDRIQQFFTESMVNLGEGVGYTPLIIAILSIFYIFSPKFKKESLNFKLLVMPLLIILFYYAGFKKQQSHYYMILYPYTVLWTALFLHAFDSHKFKKYLYGLVFALPVILSVQQTLIFTLSDTRVQLYKYLQQNLTRDTIILYNTKEFDQIVEKFDNTNQTKRLTKDDGLRKYTNAILVAKNPEPEYTNQLTSEYQFEIVKEYSDFMRNGPNITIFKTK